ncbi:Zinc finger Ran-binding domain-containing protein 2 [Bulinus truncatus]|nr:Zinc finger Ran-binding domain-containing protein 2 [Bulinus truncatus]
MEENWDEGNVEAVRASFKIIDVLPDNRPSGKSSLASTFIGKTIRGLGRGQLENSDVTSSDFGQRNKAHMESRSEFRKTYSDDETGKPCFGASRSNDSQFPKQSENRTPFGGFASIRSSGFNNNQNNTEHSDKEYSGFGRRDTFANKEEGRGFGRGNDRNGRPGDWICPDENCGNNNFASRKACHKCDTPKPDNGENNSGMSFGRNNSDGRGFGQGNDRNGRPGDWICPDENCGNNNFASRKVCHKCDTPKPDNGDNNSGMGFGRNNSGFGGSEQRGAGRGQKGEEWMCPNDDCNNNNFAFRKVCMKCNTAKPGGSESSSTSSSLHTSNTF